MTAKKSILPAAILPIVILTLLITSWASAGENTKKDYTNRNMHTQKVDITMDNYEFRPDTITIQAGHPAVFTITNKGTTEHEFMAGKKVTDDTDGFKTDLFRNVEVEKSVKEEKEHQKVMKEHAEEGHNEEMGENGEEEHHGTMIELEPGQTGMMKFTLPSSKVGTWKIGCFEETGEKYHYQLGMNGVLIVKPE